MDWIHSHPYAFWGTPAVVVFAFILNKAVRVWIRSRDLDIHESFRKRQFATTIIALFAGAAVLLLWSRMIQAKGTFFGLLGAGLAVALREPLLAIAGRIAIFAGHMYRVGDRIEILQMSGDVIDIGFFYTRLMEIGNWVKGDQASGRITQFSNSIIFGQPVYNYTQNFDYLWDEIVLPITYGSDLDRAKEIVLSAGCDYTREFWNQAENQLEKMRRSFLVPQVDLKPSAFVDVTDNYVKVTLRYIVDPRQRRVARSFIFSRALELLRNEKGISFGSTTMDLTLHNGDAPQQPSEEERPPSQNAA